MGIIDDYLSSDEKDKSAPEKPSGLIEQYLNQGEPTTKRIYVSPAKPPISGVSKEESDRINSEEGQKGGVNPRSQESYAGRAAGAVYDAAKSGVLTAGTGIGDIFSQKPVTGVGEIGSGALSVLTSPLAGVEQLAGDVTGNKDFANRAGFVAGAALPVVPGAKAVSKARPTNKALSTLVENIGEENLPAVVSAMKANPRLGPADLSPRVLQDTQHLFANDGPQIDYLSKTSAARMASRKDSIAEAYDASGGVPPDLAQKITDLASASRKVGEEQINPLVKSAKPVNVSNTVENINKILKPGIMSKISAESTLPTTEVKNALAAAKSWLVNGKELRTGAEDLHDIQVSLRRQGYALVRSGGAGAEIGHALLKVRNDLVADIDKASPGYSKALENYRDEMHIADAFKKGHDDIFTSSKKIENDPSFVKKWYDGLSEHEKIAAKEGARAAVYTEMGVAKNGALAGESVARSDFNKAKMEILFGKEEATALLNKLDAERAIANTHNKVVEGSQTAMRTASKSQFALPDKTQVMKSAPMLMAAEGANFFYGGYPGAATAAAALAKGGAMAKDAIKMKLAREHNATYAKYALPTEGPSRDELIKALEARIPGPKQSLLTRGSNALSRIVAP